VEEKSSLDSMGLGERKIAGSFSTHDPLAVKEVLVLPKPIINSHGRGG
jgi:hypothetical protein